MDEDTYFQHWMSMALNLAGRHVGLTAENPSVGAVIVKDNKLISYAVTAKSGRPHAETIAINEANADDVIGSDLFVTLEPCCHQGQTPPCTDLIIQSGIKRVIIATLDPDKRVDGNSISVLRDVGIEVVTGVLENQASDLTRGFIYRNTKNRPFITVKMAVSLDGKIACGNYHSKWLSNDLARKFAHFLRLHNDAIMVGKNTYHYDKPQLNCRLHGCEDKKLLKVVLDCNLEHNYPNNQQDLVIYTNKNIEIEYTDIKYISSQENFLSKVCEDLAMQGINNLLVEGGGELFTSLFKEKLVDCLILIRVPIILGNDAIPMATNLGLDQITNAPKLKHIESFRLLDNNVEIFEF